MVDFPSVCLIAAATAQWTQASLLIIFHSLLRSSSSMHLIHQKPSKSYLKIKILQDSKQEDNETRNLPKWKEHRAGIQPS